MVGALKKKYFQKYWGQYYFSAVYFSVSLFWFLLFGLACLLMPHGQGIVLFVVKARALAGHLFLRNQHSFFLVFYPREYLWRPIVGMILLVVFWFHFQQKKNWNKSLFIKLVGVFFYWLLLRGVGSYFVSTDKWGGLLLHYCLRE